MLFAISVLTIAVLGIDRVDFFGGTGPVILTPFLVLSPFVLLLMLLRFSHRPYLELQIGSNRSILLFLLSSLIIILLLSALFSNDIYMSSKRMALLTYEIFFLIIVSGLWDTRTLLVGSYVGFFIFTVFNIVLTVNWIYLHTGLLTYIDFGSVFDLSPLTIGPLTTRFCGFAQDPNHGTFILGVFIYIIYKYGKNSILYKFILVITIVSVFFSLSKSGVTSFILMFLCMLFVDRRNVNFRSTIRIAFFMTISGIILLAFWGGFSIANYTFNITDIIAEIFSIAEGTSGKKHLILLLQGVNVATDNVKNVLLGDGIFAPQKVLSNIFPQDKWANFHSIYISFMAGSGLISFLLYLILLLYPIIAKTQHIPLLVLIGVFGIFYQAHLSPIFWFSLMLVWRGIKNHEFITQKSWNYRCYSQ